jgi:hypothetical protein
MGKAGWVLDADEVSFEGLDGSFCSVGCTLVVGGYKVVGDGLGREEI